MLEEYSRWLLSTNANEGKLFIERFDKQWHALVDEEYKVQSENYGLLGKGDEFSIRVMENFSATVAAGLFEQEIREIVSYFFQAFFSIRKAYPFLLISSFS